MAQQIARDNTVRGSHQRGVRQLRQEGYGVAYSRVYSGRLRFDWSRVSDDYVEQTERLREVEIELHGEANRSAAILCITRRFATSEVASAELDESWPYTRE